MELTANRPDSFDIDIFSDEAISNPYPAFAAIRAAGSVVRLEKYGIWALPRFASVRAALLNWETFSSEAAVYVEPEFNEFYRGTVIASDRPVHDQLRKVLAERLSRTGIREMRAILGAMVKHFEEINIGEAKRHYNNAMRGLGSLPVAVKQAASY